MLNLHKGFEESFPQHDFEKSLCDHYITIIFQQQRNLEALIHKRLKENYNNAINVRISLEGYGSKIRKVSRYRPTVSNETILATKQELFFTKVAPVQSITDIVLLGFSLILLRWMFISSYTTIYFFVNNFFFRKFIFQWIRYSNVSICFLVDK